MSLPLDLILPDSLTPAVLNTGLASSLIEALRSSYGSVGRALTHALQEGGGKTANSATESE